MLTARFAIEGLRLRERTKSGMTTYRYVSIRQVLLITIMVLRIIFLIVIMNARYE